MKRLSPAMIRFIVVTALFTILFIIMVAMHIKSIWLWVGFVILWTIVELIAAKDVHLKWWQWGLFLVGLGLIDVVVLSLS